MKYQLIIRIPFNSMDDLDARQFARDILSNIDQHVFMDIVEKKLQRVYDDKPPEKVDLKLNITPP